MGIQGLLSRGPNLGPRDQGRAWWGGRGGWVSGCTLRTNDGAAPKENLTRVGRISLRIQWLVPSSLPMKGAQVRSLVGELDTTRRVA